nr:helix-turn-helix domain-containing protein [Candidatus Sigynarchaeum springense]
MKRRKRLEMEASDDRIELAFISKVQHGISTNNIAKQMGVSTRTAQRWLALRKNKDSRYWSGQSNMRV